jgi:hypothetical protein
VKVYTVEYCEYNDHGVYGVFSTQELAEAQRKNILKLNKVTEDKEQAYTIEEYEMDSEIYSDKK